MRIKMTALPGIIFLLAEDKEYEAKWSIQTSNSRSRHPETGGCCTSLELEDFRQLINLTMQLTILQCENLAMLLYSNFELVCCKNF